MGTVRAIINIFGDTMGSRIGGASIMGYRYCRHRSCNAIRQARHCYIRFG